MVDIGNGHVTLIPTILFALCMTWDLMPARIMGIIGIIMHWQELYGETGLVSFSEMYSRLPAMAVSLSATGSGSSWYQPLNLFCQVLPGHCSMLLN
jgi:hypothetical protein